ncbi:hypothetical protein KSS87_005484 [Heliosperma pusillum]|nr:hypothetical protein KSS87_005484 [Heliosperma pusillum]
MLEKAIKLFHTWISKGKEVDTVTYNTLIACLCKEGRLEDALEFVKDMVNNKLEPDKYTYNAIFNALIGAGRTAEAEEFRESMIKTGKLLDQSLQPEKPETDDTDVASSERVSCSRDFSKQINQLCVEGRYKEAMDIYEEASQEGIAVDKTTYFTLIEGLLKRRKGISKGPPRE